MSDRTHPSEPTKIDPSKPEKTEPERYSYRLKYPYEWNGEMLDAGAVITPTNEQEDAGIDLLKKAGYLASANPADAARRLGPMTTKDSGSQPPQPARTTTAATPAQQPAQPQQPQRK